MDTGAWAPQNAGMTPNDESAPAKLNLYLHVLGRRDDGYHRLDSLVAFAGIGDVLHAAESDALSLQVGGPFAAGLSNEPNNLVLRAATALADAAGIVASVHLTLEKHLPVASGIGGGSADAAAALRLLCRFWSCTPDPTVLASIALSLGADVPACLALRTTRMSGIGERLEQAPALPDCGVVLVNPLVPLATADVFQARSGPFSPAAKLPDGWADAAAMAADLARLTNDLEPPARRLAPAIDRVLTALAGSPECLLARMSGSGATCFGLFPDSLAAEAAAAALQAPGWWVWGGGLRSS